MRRRLVSKANSIYVVLVISYAKDGLPRFKIIYNHGIIPSASNNLTAISRKSDGPDLRKTNDQKRISEDMISVPTAKPSLPKMSRLALPPGDEARSKTVGSEESSGSVGARQTRWRSELYAKNLLSGLNVASVIVHEPKG